jgi:hypothetical protein
VVTGHGKINGDNINSVKIEANGHFRNEKQEYERRKE